MSDRLMTAQAMRTHYAGVRERLGFRPTPTFFRQPPPPVKPPEPPESPDVTLPAATTPADLRLLTRAAMKIPAAPQVNKPRGLALYTVDDRGRSIMPEPGSAVVAARIRLAVRIAGEVAVTRPGEKAALIYLRAASRAFGVPREALLSKERTAPVVLVRQVAFTLAAEFGKASLPAIGRAFNRDHTTVLHGRRRMLTFVRAALAEIENTEPEPARASEGGGL